MERFKIKIITCLLFVILSIIGTTFSYSQENEFTKGNFYTIDEIKVTGLKTFNEQTVVTYTGLFQGQNIRLPGEEISQVINKLWKLELFSDINFYVTNIVGDKASIEINIVELPSLSDYKITGLKKSKAETIETDIEIKKGQKITENFIETTKNYIVNKYRKNGFLNTCLLYTSPSPRD